MDGLVFMTTKHLTKQQKLLIRRTRPLVHFFENYCRPVFVHSSQLQSFTRRNFGALESLIFRDVLTSAHWELTWRLEGTLASFASTDKPSDNKRDEGYTIAAIANPFSRVPLFCRKPFEPINHPKTDSKPGTFHRFGRKRVQFYEIPSINVTMSANQ